MAQMHIEVMVVRIVCAFLMHLESEPEVRQALAMFKFGLNQTKTKQTVIELCNRAFEEIVFIKDDSGNPELFKWLTREEADTVRKSKRPIWKTDHNGNEYSVSFEELQNKFEIDRFNKDRSHFVTAFQLLKRCQSYLGIQCRHGVPDDVRLVLQYTQHIKAEQGQNPGNLVGEWEQNRKCGYTTFNWGELEFLHMRLGFKFAGKLSDKMLFRANKDRNSEFTVEDFIRVYRTTQKAYSAKRRVLADKYIKITTMSGLTNWLSAFCARSSSNRAIIRKLASQQGLDEQEVEKLMEDVDFVKKTVELSEEFHKNKNESLLEKIFVLKNYDDMTERRRLTSLATSVLLMEEKKKKKDPRKPLQILQDLLQKRQREGNAAAKLAESKSPPKPVSGLQKLINLATRKQVVPN